MSLAAGGEGVLFVVFGNLHLQFLRISVFKKHVSFFYGGVYIVVVPFAKT